MRTFGQFVESIGKLTKQQAEFVKRMEESNVRPDYTPGISMSFIWCVDDVQCVARCNKAQALDVLQSAHHHHDANYGIGWETLRSYAEDAGLKIKY